ncbi:MAG: NAD(P)-dependent oxidoreductase [Rhizobiales bacterium]|nr:NAD(P)-dependent oxidoreductase [Hyphomicrobiales bacterium]
MTAGMHVTGTSRSEEGTGRIRAMGAEGVVFEPGRTGALPLDPSITHLLVSVPPTDPRKASPGLEGPDDPVLATMADAIRALPKLEWIGYLSTIGVYGDRGGAWIDEEAELVPSSERSARRVRAERAWLDFGAAMGCRVQVFRLAGIYGPGRNVIESLRRGRERLVIKKGQVFNRIHADDIARTVLAGMASQSPVSIFNVTDDEPAAPQEVMAFAAALAGLALPPAVPFEEAELSEMARTFYGECKRVRNQRIKSVLGVELAYPTYREGLRAVWAAEQAGGNGG